MDITMKQKLFRCIDDYKQDLVYLADKIFDDPECGYQEYNASKMLCDYLEGQGFLVERGIAQLETAFTAIWSNRSGGPSIGFLCEYDALQRVGHACGHHLQGPAVIGAALALRETLDKLPSKLIIYGTPAEETTGGKIKMVDAGCFRESEAVLAYHAGTDVSRLGGHYKALKSYVVTFSGTGAHASSSPHEGRSALDAMILSFNGIEYLREHIKDGCRMHYTVLEATGPSNVVHERARALYTLRANDDDYLDEMKERFDRIMKGAALMTDTTFEIKANAQYSSGVVLDSFNEVGLRNLKLVDEKRFSMTPMPSGGSSDFANVTNVVPGLMLYTAYCQQPAHTQAWVDAGKSEAAYRSMLDASKAMAGTAYDIITDGSLLASIKQEFKGKARSKNS